MLGLIQVKAIIADSMERDQTHSPCLHISLLSVSAYLGPLMLFSQPHETSDLSKTNTITRALRSRRDSDDALNGSRLRYWQRGFFPEPSPNQENGICTGIPLNFFWSRESLCPLPGYRKYRWCAHAQTLFDFHYRQQTEKVVPLTLILNTMKRSDYKIWRIIWTFRTEGVPVPAPFAAVPRVARRAAWQRSSWRAVLPGTLLPLPYLTTQQHTHPVQSRPTPARHSPSSHASRPAPAKVLSCLLYCAVQRSVNKLPAIAGDSAVSITCLLLIRFMQVCFCPAILKYQVRYLSVPRHLSGNLLVKRIQSGEFERISNTAT